MQVTPRAFSEAQPRQSAVMHSIMEQVSIADSQKQDFKIPKFWCSHVTAGLTHTQLRDLNRRDVDFEDCGSLLTHLFGIGQVFFFKAVQVVRFLFWVSCAHVEISDTV